MKERDHSIDILKGIGILLVIIGHCDLFGRVSSLIYSFHMPLFIILSGYFYSYKDDVRELAMGGGKIVKAYLITAILTCIIFLSFGMHDFISCLSMIFYAHGWPQNTLLFPTEDWIGPTWFLMALFCCRIYYNYIVKLSKKDYRMACVISIGISWIAIFVGRQYINLPLGLLTGLSFIGFYSIGVLIGKIEKLIPYAALLSIAWIAYYPALSLVCFGYGIYPISLISVSGLSLAFIFILRKFLQYVNKNDIIPLSFLGERSLQVLCVHQLTYHLGTYLQLGNLLFFMLNLLVPILYIVFTNALQKSMVK